LRTPLISICSDLLILVLQHDIWSHFRDSRHFRPRWKQFLASAQRQQEKLRNFIGCSVASPVAPARVVIVETPRIVGFVGPETSKETL